MVVLNTLYYRCWKDHICRNIPRCCVKYANIQFFFGHFVLYNDRIVGCSSKSLDSVLMQGKTRKKSIYWDHYSLHKDCFLLHFCKIATTAFTGIAEAASDHPEFRSTSEGIVYKYCMWNCFSSTTKGVIQNNTVRYKFLNKFWGQSW